MTGACVVAIRVSFAVSASPPGEIGSSSRFEAVIVRRLRGEKQVFSDVPEILTVSIAQAVQNLALSG